MSQIVQGSQTVSFQNIHFERPLIDDHWCLEDYSYEDYNEFEFLTSFAFVVRPNMVDQLELVHGNGEDIHEWMALIPDTHTLFGDSIIMAWHVY